MYELGRGVARDDREAMTWYAKSADQGTAEAQFNCGIMYRTGRGVTRDIAEAHKWFKLAAATFPKSEVDKRASAVRNCKLTAAQLTSKQIAKGRRFAGELRPG
jgi:TPR repeat protein